MCNPALIPAAIALVGARVGAYGQIQAGKSAERIEKQNAYNAEAAAADAATRGHQDEELHRLRVRAMMGSQRATFAANNVDMNSGSPLGLLVETANQGELDALLIRNNAAREAMGLRQEATNARARGKSTKSERKFSGGGTLLAGAANSYGMWRDAPKKVS